MHLCTNQIHKVVIDSQKKTHKFENIRRKTIPVVVAAEEATLVFLEALGVVLRA